MRATAVANPPVIAGAHAVVRIIDARKRPALAVRIGADNVVLSVHALQLPKRAEPHSGFRLERMESEKVTGRALMYLIVAWLLDGGAG